MIFPQCRMFYEPQDGAIMSDQSNIATTLITERQQYVIGVKCLMPDSLTLKYRSSRSILANAKQI